MRQVPVLLSANFDAAQVAAIRAAHPAIVLHGEEGGYAIDAIGANAVSFLRGLRGEPVGG